MYFDTFSQRIFLEGHRHFSFSLQLLAVASAIRLSARPPLKTPSLFPQQTPAPLAKEEWEFYCCQLG